MHEQRTEPSSEEPITRRLYHETSGGTRPPQAPPRTDHTRALAFVLIGLGLAMLLSNMGKLPFVQGRERTYEVVAALDGTTAAQVRFDWGNGSLRLATGQGSDLVWGSVETSRPVVVDVYEHDDDNGPVADVTIQPGETGWLFGNQVSASGDVMLNEQTHYNNLEFDLGSGSASLNLSGLNVTELNIDGGSGRIDLQLPAQGTIKGEIENGSGSLNMTLPATIEARIVLDKASGSFDAGDRLKLVEGDADEGVYETPGYADAQERIELELDSGSGSIVIN